MPDDTDIITRRRQARAASKKRNLIIGVAVAGAVGFAVVAGACGLLALNSGARVAVVGPSESREGETWTLRDMFEFLKGKGIVSSMSEGVDLFDGYSLSRMSPESGKGINVMKFPTKQKAKDHVGLVPNNDRSFSWGNFAFEGSPDAVQQVRKALR